LRGGFAFVAIAGFVLATLGGGVLLLAGGLVAEFLCRVPPQDDDDDHPDRGPERVHL
jgi:hypothetical protein